MAGVQPPVGGGDDGGWDGGWENDIPLDPSPIPEPEPLPEPEPPAWMNKYLRMEALSGAAGMAPQKRNVDDLSKEDLIYRIITSYPQPGSALDPSDTTVLPMSTTAAMI